MRHLAPFPQSFSTGGQAPGQEFNPLFRFAYTVAEAYSAQVAHRARLAELVQPAEAGLFPASKSSYLNEFSMRKYLIGIGLVVVGLVGLARAWWVKGHESIAEAAASRLPDEMPAFFRAGGKHLAHCAGDPDRWKNPVCKHLRAAEAANHFLDMEDLQGQDLPADRFKAIAMIAQLKQRADQTGLLPYALLENYDKLTCAFYDYRADPNNPVIQMKCLVYAGALSHYTGDACMPLHTTRDFDGRKQPDGKILQKGIHAKIDAFPEKNMLSPEEISRGLEARAVEDVWAYALQTIQESHTHIDRCYELDKAGAFDKPTAESRQFILHRCRAAAQFTMNLWYSAWVRSKTLPAHY